MQLRELTKAVLVKAGARSSERTLHRVNGLLGYLELGFWLRERGFSGGLRLGSIADVLDAVCATVGRRRTICLQIGARDYSMVERCARALAHPQARFSVLEPLAPRDEWLPSRGFGHWSESSRESVPISPGDPRIRCLRLTDASLDGSNAEAIIACFDADHYSSTKAGLDLLCDDLPPEAFLVFDHLNHRADDLRAFHEFLLDTDLRFELFAANHALSAFAFRQLPAPVRSRRRSASRRCKGLAARPVLVYRNAISDPGEGQHVA